MLDPVEEKTCAARRRPVRESGRPEAAGVRPSRGHCVPDGQDYRALATAGFAPERITPTVDEPADFDAFWTAGKEALAKLPVDAKLVPMPESSNGKVDCWHVSLQNVGPDTTGTSRLFGMLCEPKGAGPFPGAAAGAGRGVRAYRATWRWPRRA